MLRVQQEGDVMPAHRQWVNRVLESQSAAEACRPSSYHVAHDGRDHKWNGSPSGIVACPTRGLCSRTHHPRHLVVCQSTGAVLESANLLFVRLLFHLLWRN